MNEPKTLDKGKEGQDGLHVAVSYVDPTDKLKTIGHTGADASVKTSQLVGLKKNKGRVLKDITNKLEPKAHQIKAVLGF